MSGHERQPPHDPNALPPELVAFLRERPYACLTQPTDQGTALIVKAPRRDIESVRGRVPIAIRHELYDHPAAPVIRMVLTIFDQPDRPLALEVFINVEDPAQRAEYGALAEQDEIPLLFYDERVQHRLNKTVGNFAQESVRQVLVEADSLFAGIPQDRFSFERAKADVMRATTL